MRTLQIQLVAQAPPNQKNGRWALLTLTLLYQTAGDALHTTRRAE
jgi:hypothetical protein